MNIIPAEPRHASQVAEIYNHYIQNTVVTFETENVTEEEMLNRITDIQKKYEWLVMEDDNGVVVGYAYYGNFRGRAAYNNTVESTIYLNPKYTGKGLGKVLYGTLLQQAIDKGFKEIIGGIALPNDQSVKLHENLGFDKVGHLRSVGRKFDKWIDVGFWQKTVY